MESLARISNRSTNASTSVPSDSSADDWGPSPATRGRRGGGCPGLGHIVGAEELRTLRQLAVRLVGRSGDPDDLLQDALERALKSFDRFQVGTNFVAWMRTIMQRLVIDDWRRGGRIRNVCAESHALIAPEPETEPEWARHDMQDVREALMQLREPLRGTFRLLLDGLSYAEIASRLDIPLATVGTRLRRARQRLKRALEQGTCSGVPAGAAARSDRVACPPPSVRLIERPVQWGPARGRHDAAASLRG